MPAPRCPLQRGVPAAVQGIHGGPVLEEQAHNGFLSVHGRPGQRRLANTAGWVWTWTGVDDTACELPLHLEQVAVLGGREEMSNQLFLPQPVAA